MKTPQNNDTALRKALSRLASRQPAPPDGMARRFLDRMEREGSVPSISKKTVGYARRVRLWWAGAAAAAVVAAGLWWAQPRPSGSPAEIAAAPDEPKMLARATSIPAVETTVAEPVRPGKRQGIALPKGGSPVCAAAPPLHKAADTATVVLEPERYVADFDTTGSSSPARQREAIQQVVQANAPVTSLGKPSISFTAHERELDRRSDNPRNRYAHLIAGEAIAVQRIATRESLSSALQTLHNPTNKQAKPISI